jgi:hypothetical protein
LPIDKISPIPDADPLFTKNFRNTKNGRVREPPKQLLSGNSAPEGALTMPPFLACLTACPDTNLFEQRAIKQFGSLSVSFVDSGLCPE